MMVQVLDYSMPVEEYDSYVARFTAEWEEMSDFWREDYEGLEDYIDSRFYDEMYAD